MAWKFEIGQVVTCGGRLSKVVNRADGEYTVHLIHSNYDKNVMARDLQETEPCTAIYTGETYEYFKYAEQYDGYVANGWFYQPTGEKTYINEFMSPAQFEYLSNLQFILVSEPYETDGLKERTFAGKTCHMVPTRNPETNLLFEDAEPNLNRYNKPLVKFDEWFVVPGHYSLHQGNGRLTENRAFWVDKKVLQPIKDGMVICPCCGNSVPVSEMRIAGKCVVCNGCANDKVVSWVTGTEMPKFIAQRVSTKEGDKWVSMDEMRELVIPDDDTDHFYKKEDTTRVDGTVFTKEYVAFLIRSGKAAHCTLCGDIHFTEEMIEADGGWACNRCLSGIIGPYHSSPDPIFNDGTRKNGSVFGDDPFFGVEHELGYVGNNNNRLAYILNKKFKRHCEHDSSIPDGFEVISQPMTLDCWKNNEDINAYMLHIVSNHYKRSAKTGIHVHISTQNLNKHGIAEICRFVYANYDLLLKFGRRNPDYTDYCEYATVRPSMDDDTILDRNNRTRYYAVNTEHLDELNIELRFFASTSDAPHFWAILEFCYALEKAAESGVVNWNTIVDIAKESGKCENFLKEVSNNFESDVDYEYHCVSLVL